MDRIWWFISARFKLAAIAIPACLGLLAAVSVHCQEPAMDYKNVFGNHYLQAEQFLEENQWMADSLHVQGFDPCFAFALIFPELIRYSSIRDYIETKGLEVLYVQYGTAYANFSIGHFQLKPSFAVQVEEDSKKWLTPDEPLNRLVRTTPDTNGIIQRRERLFRLKDVEGQLLYLQSFIRLMEYLCPEWDTLPLDTRLRYYASAYNCGYRKGREYIEGISDQKYFYTGLPVNATKYSYTDISSFFYQSCKLDARE